MLIANFQYQFYSKVRYFDPEFRLEAENRRCFSPGRPCLFAPRQAGIKACRPWGKTSSRLGRGRHDFTGASVAVDAVAHRKAPYFYQARVVARMKRESVAAAERGETLELALRRALDAVERLFVRERRRLYSKPWQAH